MDNFENVVVNIHKDEFEEQRKGRKFSIVFKRGEVIDKVSENYADVNEGEKLAHFNSAGYLEISLNKGNAAGLLGLQGRSVGVTGICRKSITKPVAKPIGCFFKQQPILSNSKSIFRIIIYITTKK